MKATKTMAQPKGVQTFFLNEYVGKLFASVLGSLPTDTAELLNRRLRMVTDSKKMAEAHSLLTGAIASAVKSAGGDVIYLDSEKLKSRHESEIAAIIAHEMAHVALGHTAIPLASVKAEDLRLHEEQAETKAASWGFRRLQKEVTDRMVIINNQYEN